jgi:hypothetical protein
MEDCELVVTVWHGAGSSVRLRVRTRRFDTYHNSHFTYFSKTTGSYPQIAYVQQID